jgi:competence protein ComEA
MRPFLSALLLTALLPLQGRGPKAPPEPVDLNTATATELMQLPRVGARTAQRILDYRKTHGPFRRVEELMNVKGIGEKAFLRLRPHLRVEEAP